MEKKNICIITQCSLPIPTTKGGAVETLVEYILMENERMDKYHFTVISHWHRADWFQALKEIMIA